MRKGRILAMDYGTKNVGLACSDELGVTTRPLPSIPYRSRANLLSSLQLMLSEHSFDEIVVGMPFNMDGSAGEAATRVRRLIELLSKKVAVPVVAVDERLSTVEANEVWQSMNRRQQLKYRTVDSLAAAFILERYLRETGA